MLIDHAYARAYVRLHVLSWRLVGDVAIVVVRLAAGLGGAAAVLLMLREVVRRAVLRLSLQVPHVRRLHVAARLLLSGRRATMHHVIIARVTAHIVHLLINHTCLVVFIHAEPRSILVSQFKLGLVALNVAPLGQGVDARLLHMLSHVFPHVLCVALFQSAVLALLDIAEVVCVEEQTRVLLLLLQESHR